MGFYVFNCEEQIPLVFSSYLDMENDLLRSEMVF